jgi:hypothetical protein
MQTVMKFIHQEVTIALSNSKDDLTKAQAVTIMEQFIAKEIFTSTKEKPTRVVYYNSYV